MAIAPMIEQLSQVKNEQVKTKTDLATARTNLMACSLIEEPEEWNALLDVVTTISMKLGEINNELKKLEHIHVDINRGVLPYQND